MFENMGRDLTRLALFGIGVVGLLGAWVGSACVGKDAVKVASPEKVEAKVEAAVDATANLDAMLEARVTAAVNSFETRIGKIETTLSSTTTTNTNMTAGRDVVESEVAKALAAAMGQREWISLIKQLGLAVIAIPLGGWWYQKMQRPKRLARERQSQVELA